MPFCDEIVSRRDFFRINFLWELIRPEQKLRGTSVLARQKIIFSKNQRIPVTTLICSYRSHHLALNCPSFFDKAPMLVDTEALQLLGFSAALLLLCGALALIDVRRGIIPDGLNLSIAGLGLVKVVIAGGATAGIEIACEGTVIGLTFWLLRRLYFAWRKVQGLGLGDVKFLVAATPWIGIAGIPTLLLIATLTALAAAGSLQLAGRGMTRQTSLPFGPFLAIGLLLTFVSQQFLGTI
jgi:leader peptidase (prepilin peptidase)/N-methyltransferase